MGNLQAYISVTAILLVISSWRYEFAIALPNEDRIAFNVLIICFAILLLTIILISTVIHFWGSSALALLKAKTLKPFLWFIPAGILGGGCYQILTFWAVRKNEFRTIAKTHLSRSIGQIFSQICLGVLKTGANGLIIGDVVGKCSGVWTIYKNVLSKDMYLFKKASMVDIKHTAWRYRDFPIISCSSALINSLGLHLPALLLMSFFGSSVVGWYALSQRIINIPLTMIGKSVGQVYLGRASKLLQKDPIALKDLFLKTALKLLIISFSIIGIIALVSPWFFSIIFGEGWKQAGVYVQVLAFPSISKFIVNPLCQTLIVLERQNLQLLWDVSRLFIMGSGFAGAYYLQWSDIETIGLFAFLTVLSYIWLFFINLYALKSHNR